MTAAPIGYQLRRVPFHGLLRHVLIDQGWTTASVADGVATMVRPIYRGRVYTS